jgi:hypothetical protein
MAMTKLGLSEKEGNQGRPQATAKLERLKLELE